MPFQQASKLFVFVDEGWPNLDFAERKLQYLIDTLGVETIDVVCSNERAVALNDHIEQMCGNRRVIQVSQRDDVDLDLNDLFEDEDKVASVVFSFGEDELVEDVEDVSDLFFNYDKSDLNLQELTSGDFSIEDNEVVYDPS